MKWSTEMGGGCQGDRGTREGQRRDIVVLRRREKSRGKLETEESRDGEEQTQRKRKGAQEMPEWTLRDAPPEAEGWGWGAFPFAGPEARPAWMETVLS